VKLTHSQLQEIIHRSLLTEIKGEKKLLSKAIQKLGEAGDLDEATVLAAKKAVGYVYDRGSKVISEKLTNSKKATKLLVRHGFISGAVASAIGMFGAYSVVSGVFAVLPAMIKRTIDRLSTVDGSFLNFYRLKNIQQIGTDKPQEPITWDEYGDSTGAYAGVVDNFGVKIRTKEQIATILAASKLSKNPEDDIMDKIEKIGLAEYGDDEGYERIFDQSWRDEIRKRTDALREQSPDDLPTDILKELVAALKSKDKRKIKAFVDIVSAIT